MIEDREIFEGNDGQEEVNFYYYETEFFALCVITGEIKPFIGTYVAAPDLSNALKFIRESGFDYLQLTGNYYKSYDEMISHTKFYQKLSDPKGLVKAMNYDDFNDWLDLALSIDDLNAAKIEFKKVELFEYVKIIDAYIKNKFLKND